MAEANALPMGLSYSKVDGWSYTEEIAKVRDLFRRFLAGERNFSALGRRYGLHLQTVRYMLANPVYSGWLVWGEKRARGRDMKVARSPEAVIRAPPS